MDEKAWLELKFGGTVVMMKPSTIENASLGLLEVRKSGRGENVGWYYGSLDNSYM